MVIADFDDSAWMLMDAALMLLRVMGRYAEIMMKNGVIMSRFCEKGGKI